MNKRKLIIITDREGREEFLFDYLTKYGSGIFAIVLRSVVDVKSASAKLLSKCREQGVYLLAHSNLENIKFCDGIHLNAKSKSVKDVRKEFGNDIIIGYSSHSVEEAKQALANGANYVFLSPVFESKDGLTTPMGIDTFNLAVEKIGSGVYALGGVNERNFALLNSKASGYAAMSSIWK